jgi:hypothetical protein
MARMQGKPNISSAVARIQRKIEIIFSLYWDTKRRMTIRSINKRIGDEYCRKEGRIYRNERIGVRKRRG